MCHYEHLQPHALAQPVVDSVPSAEDESDVSYQGTVVQARLSRLCERTIPHQNH